MPLPLQRLPRAVLLAAITCLLLLCAPAAAAAQGGQTPIPPLRAWEVAADGAVYVLDATGRLYELDARTLAPLAGSGGGAFSASKAQIAAGADRLFLGGNHGAGIQVFDRQTLSRVESIPIDAAALALEPGKRLFVIERRPAAIGEGLWTFAVVTLPLDDLQAKPQDFGPTATQPFGSLFDLVVDREQGLLYVGVFDSSGSPNRHYRTYRAYDLQTGEEVDLGLDHQAASTALRPVLGAAGGSAVSSVWEGIFPQQQRIYLLSRGEKPQTIENLSGPLAYDAARRWLYVVRQRSLWMLEAVDNAGFVLKGVIPLLQQPPADIRISPDGGTLYLFGNGWLTALPVGKPWPNRVESVSPLPAAWTSPMGPTPQTARLFSADDDFVGLLNLQPSNEWYRSALNGLTRWTLLPDVQYPEDLRLDRMSLSPTISQDQVAAARGGWRDGARTTWLSLDAGASWGEWTPPIAYVAGSAGARTLYIAGAPGAAARTIPLGGSTENPAWSPGWTHLAFQNNRAGDWEIYRAPADCSAELAGPSSTAKECAVQRLTDSAGDDLLPAWSPDGRMIAFVSLRDGNPEIYVMLADGSQQTRLTFAPSGDWRPAWLPDSRHLVFTSDRNGNNDIFTLQVPWVLPGDTAREPLVSAVVASPADERDGAVNGDGELLFLSDRDGVMQPYSADLASFLASSSRTPLTGSPVLAGVQSPIGHPGWLADGDLLFAAGNGIYRAPRYTAADQWQELAAPEDEALHPAPGPTWSWPEPRSLPEP